MFLSLLRWLGLDKPNVIVGLRPHRTVDLDLPYDAAYDRVISALDSVLGANVRDARRETGEIDADFGTIGSERIRVSLERLGDGDTRVHIEARYPAASKARERSLAVATLANYLSSEL